MAVREDGKHSQIDEIHILYSEEPPPAYASVVTAPENNNATIMPSSAQQQQIARPSQHHNAVDAPVSNHVPHSANTHSQSSQLPQRSQIPQRIPQQSMQKQQHHQQMPAGRATAERYIPQNMQQQQQSAVPQHNVRFREQPKEQHHDQRILSTRNSYTNV
jgi:hypothetical protein